MIRFILLSVMLRAIAIATMLVVAAITPPSRTESAKTVFPAVTQATAIPSNR